MKSNSTSLSSLGQVSRRKLLLGGLALGSMGALTSRGLTAPADPTDISDFLVLSEFLTGKKNLSPVLARRYYVGLHSQFSDFLDKVSNLSQEIKASGTKNMDDYLSHSPTEAARSTATQIVSAWYLGVIGENPQKRLLAYSDALMFLPVAGALVVPSYGAGPLAWGDRPEPIMTFQGAPHEH